LTAQVSLFVAMETIVPVPGTTFCSSSTKVALWRLAVRPTCVNPLSRPSPLFNCTPYYTDWVGFFFSVRAERFNLQRACSQFSANTSYLFFRAFASLSPTTSNLQ
jgi:hypothetical protein